MTSPNTLVELLPDGSTEYIVWPRKNEIISASGADGLVTVKAATGAKEGIEMRWDAEWVEEFVECLQQAIKDAREK